MVNNFWSTRGIPKEIEARVLMKAKLAQIVVLFTYLSTLFSGLIAAGGLLMPHWPIFADCKILHCVIYMGLTMGALLGFCLTAYALTFAGFYYAMHINMQLLILSAYFNSIGEGILVDVVDEKRESVLYQTVIRQRLIIGIKQHIELVR